jgi:hypothetical protein
MNIEQAQAFLSEHGKEKVQDILNNAHNDAVYYVNEWTDSFGGTHGYCTDKFIVGLHNKNTHYKLDDLKSCI